MLYPDDNRFVNVSHLVKWEKPQQNALCGILQAAGESPKTNVDVPIMDLQISICKNLVTNTTILEEAKGRKVAIF